MIENHSAEKDKDLTRHVLVISDNQELLSIVSEAFSDFDDIPVNVDYACSPVNRDNFRVEGRVVDVLDLKTEVGDIIDKNYDLVLSAHSKQIFPKQLVDHAHCINLHPGYNPYNKGMFPHIFSIMNGLPTGATLHKIDEGLDTGAIIEQTEIPVKTSDTSESLYARIIEAEKDLLKRNIGRLIVGDYEAISVSEPGNINRRTDFDSLREINPASVGSFQEHINHLRALTHGDMKNAYYVDPHTGKKVWVRIILEEEQ